MIIDHAPDGATATFNDSDGRVPDDVAVEGWR